MLQEISGMGELGGEWRRRQMDLLDKHLKLLKDYSQAKQNLQQITKEGGMPSVEKSENISRFFNQNLSSFDSYRSIFQKVVGKDGQILGIYTNQFTFTTHVGTK